MDNYIETNIPQDYLCPITQEIMTDPVIAADGQTYERESISEWLSRGNRRSPLNGSNLSNNVLIDNVILRKIIREYQSKQSYDIEQKRVRSNLEKCIMQKEELIQALIEKVDQNTINSRTQNFLIDPELTDLNQKKEILFLKKQNLQQEEMILALKKQLLNQEDKIISKDEIIIDLKNQITDLKINIKSQFIPKENRLLDPSNRNLFIHNFKFEGKNFKKVISHKMKGSIYRLLELIDGSLACWTRESGIKFLNINKEKVEVTKYLNFQNATLSDLIQQNNSQIIFTLNNEIKICNKAFKELQSICCNSKITAICNITDLSFAIGQENGHISIYSNYFIPNSNYNSILCSGNCKSGNESSVLSLLYLKKQNLLLSGHGDFKINIKHFYLSDNEYRYPNCLTGHTYVVHSMVSINDETFASCSLDGLIKIWSIKQGIIECIKDIQNHQLIFNIDTFLHSFENMLIIQSQDEFRILDSENFECIQIFKEESHIMFMIFTKNKDIIIGTENKKINIWKILK